MAKKKARVSTPRRQLVKQQPVSRAKGSARTNVTVRRTIHGMGHRGNMHLVVYLANGNLEKETLCGSWPSSWDPGDLDLPDCPVCVREAAKLTMVPNAS